jgi:putative aldouronate transport system permease protein
MKNTISPNPGDLRQKSLRRGILRDLKMNKFIYLMLLPVIANFIIFHYIPMGGIVIAFKDYNIAKGLGASEWVGFSNFISFFEAHYFWRLLRNTLSISILSILWGFPVPILMALFLNEIGSVRFKRIVQTASYLPYFLSVVIVVSLIKGFLATDGGLLNNLLNALGIESVSFLSKSEYFVTIYIVSGIWQGAGFGAIIYISAIAGIDPELYSAASIDGAGRLKRIWHITLPGIMPTVTILFILGLGGILGSDWMKIMLLQNGLTKEVSDVINLFVYERGLKNADYSFATAVGLFQSVIGFILIMASNKISKRMSDTYIF